MHTPIPQPFITSNPDSNKMALHGHVLGLPTLAFIADVAIGLISLSTVASCCSLFPPMIILYFLPLPMSLSLFGVPSPSPTSMPPPPNHPAFVTTSMKPPLLPSNKTSFLSLDTAVPSTVSACLSLALCTASVYCYFSLKTTIRSVQSHSSHSSKTRVLSSVMPVELNFQALHVTT